jgi:uracil-DNA glycosylase family 4
MKLENCRKCRRLAAHLKKLRTSHPDWHNRPVPASGSPDSALLILGLAPGMRGANRTGIPFAGDRSSEWLQARLKEAGNMNSNGHAAGVRISNAVKCLPPGNKPTHAEILSCSERWLVHELQQPRAILALGRVAHDAVVRTLGFPLRAHPFRQNAVHRLGSLLLIDSYHPSPLNTQTGRLTPANFHRALAIATQASQSTVDVLT